jgi:hypothetical protein
MRRVVSYALALSLAAALVYAQQDEGPSIRGRIWVGGGGRMPARFAKPEDFNGSFVYCRGFFQSSRQEPGGSGWRTDYPGADNNFSVRLGELTKFNVPLDENYEPHFVVVRLDEPLLFKCPLLYMEDVGTMRLNDEETKGLRDYLLKGGFLEVDDFWGTFAWRQWESEIGRVLNPGEYPIFDLPPSHPILHSLYDVHEQMQVPAISFWYRSGGDTSERGRDSAQVHFRGIQDAHGRLMVLMMHNTDIPDTWEREGENQEYFDRFSPRGYAIGVNVAVYANTH